MVIPMKNDCRNKPNSGPTSMLIRLHGKSYIVHSGIASDDAAGIRHDFLGQVEYRHHNIKRVADEPDGYRRLEHPAHDEGRLKLRHVVVLGNYLDQFVTGDKGQDDSGNGQHHISGQRFDHRKNARFKGRWSCADLLGNVTDLFVDRIEQPGQVGHDASGQKRFEPIAYGFENGFHSASPP